MQSSTQLFDLVSRHIQALRYPEQPAGLYEPIAYVLAMGGKRLRPVLLLMAYNLYKEDVAPALPAALALETYHNYTLLHDDLMDRADMRRGHPTVHRHWNENTAILSGDTMLVMAYRQLLEMHSHEALELFTRTALEIGEGQQMDMNFESDDEVTEEDYLEMIRRKTAVLLSCALSMGAMLAGASKADQDNLYRAGEQIGLAFQLQDDYLDVYGNPEVFGKKIGGDILCNKKTFLLIRALRTADAERRMELNSWMETTDHPTEKIRAVTTLYNDLGVAAEAQKRIEHYYALGMQSLAQVALPAERLSELRAYIASLLNRKN